jgi:heavy metal-binding protein/HlyD family secretion protein
MSGFLSKGRWLSGLLLVACVAVAIAFRASLAAWFLGHAGHDHVAVAAAAAGGDVAYYTCSMDPSVQAHQPGSCPICGMDLTPVTRAERDSGVVQLDAQGAPRIGARFAAAAKQTLTRRVVVLGVVSALPAGRGAGATPAEPRPPVGPGASAEPRRPAGPGAQVEAFVYGDDASVVKVGQAVRVTQPSLPLTQLEGTVAAAEPDPEARRTRLRVAVADPGQMLRPGAAAEVQIDLTLADRLVVPAKAVLYAGERRVAFVDRGQGRLEPRKLKLGAQVGGFVEVTDGLAAGDQVAIAGTFLLAAESRIRSANFWADDPKPTTLSDKAKAKKEKAERDKAKGEREEANGAKAQGEKAQGEKAQGEKAQGEKMRDEDDEGVAP